MISSLKRSSVCALAFALAACNEAEDPVMSVGDPDPPSGYAPGKDTSLPGRFIVVLRNDLPDAVASSATAELSSIATDVQRRYEHALHGFAATLSVEQAAALRADPRVAYIERDGYAQLSGTQTSAPWNLDRIDQRRWNIDSLYTYNRTGAGVTAYIIDTGIRPTHTQFGGRASVGVDLIGGNGIDCNGHGTHVAGTIGGSINGVAKGVSVVGVRVGDCAGNLAWSTVIAAVDWVTAHAVRPAVVNMSLGGSVIESVEDAIEASVATGITYVVAAGNDGIDACDVTPARMPDVITVGAIRSDQRRSSFSNHGACVDIFAPGTSIVSTSYTSDVGTVSMNGTSMASPHVAGAAALWLEGRPNSSPAAVRARILSTASFGQITEMPFGTANLLLFSRLTPQSGARAALSRASTEMILLNTGDPVFDAPTGLQPASARRALGLSNPGTDSLHWTATDNAAWLDVEPASGVLAPGAETTLDLRMDSRQLAVGDYEGLVRVGGSGVNAPVFSGVYLQVRNGAVLTSGVPIPLIWDVRDGSRYYRIGVPAGSTQLQVTVPTGSGDADLYVRPGLPPSLDAYQCRPFLDVAEETCTIPNPVAGDWWVMIHAAEGYSRLTLQATVTHP